MIKSSKTTWLCAALLAAALVPTQAQTTATWTGGSLNGLWNTAGNWDVGVPAEGTNAIIGATTVNYNAPMAATSFAGLTLAGALNINAGGFNIDAGGAVPLTVSPGGFLTINSGQVVTITNSGSVTMSTPASGTSPVIVVAGGSLILTNNFGTFFMGENTGSDNNIGAVFTNNNGNIWIDRQLRVRGRDSRFYMSGGTLNLLGGLNHDCSGNDSRQLFNIAGGTANLNDVTINRAVKTTGGLQVSGGVVNSSSLRIGIGIASANAQMTGGIWTNAGAFYIGDRANAATSGTRNPYFTMNDGYLVTLGSDGIVINNQGEASSTGVSGNGAYLVVNGGTITTEGIQLNGPSVTANSYARFQLNGGTIYLGALGLVANADSANSLTAVLTLTGGTLAAKNDWATSANLPVGGILTFKAADTNGTPHNITLNGTISGSTGSLVKTGTGTLTMGGTNTYTVPTTISEGTLSLGANASLASATINVATGTTFNVSASSFVLGTSKTIAGSGTVVGAFGTSGATINPGGISAQGTLTFANGLAVTNTIINLELTDDTTGLVKSNDTINIVGDLTADQVSPIVVTPVGSLSIGTYKLIKYTGAFHGAISNFSCIAGTVTNYPGEIDLIVTVARPTANLVWKGNGAANLWDTGVSSNWLNGASLDRFYTGDTNNFTDATTNFTVNVFGIVTPASVTFNASSNYVVAGDGDITGATALIKTNSGKLTILNTNSFIGGVSIKAGTLSVASLADNVIPSPLGKTGTILDDGGTLEYSGPTYTWTRTLTLGAAGGGYSVSDPAAVLTHGGTLVGTGSLTKTGNGTLILNNPASSYSGGTILNAGTLTINDALAASAGDITLNGGKLALGAVKPANTINVAGTSYVSGGNAGGLTGIANVTGSGNLGLSVTVGTFDLTGNMTAFSGTITFTNAGGGVVRFNGATGSALATWDLGAGPMDLNIRTGSTVNQIGALKGGPQSSLSGRGGSSNNGPTTYVIGANGQNTVFSGTVQNGAGGSSSTTSIVKTGSGRLTLNGGTTPVIGLDENFNLVTNYVYANTVIHTGTTTISNGVLALAAPALLTTSPTITLSASAAVLDVSQMGYPDGTGTNLIITGVMELMSGQTLSGIGTIRGSLLTDSGSSLNTGMPGTTGILTVTNAITLGGTTQIKLNRSASPNSGRLVSSLSSITYGGTLVVTNIGGNLQVGDTFTLFSGSGLNAATFGTLMLPSSYGWNTSQLGINGTISVTSVPTPPSITSVDYSQLASGSITINAANGTPGGPVNILSSTNLTLPVNAWTVVIASAFDGSGNLSQPITVNPAAPKTFFLLQAN